MMKKHWQQRIAIALLVIVAGVFWGGAIRHMEEVKEQEVTAEQLEENTVLLGGMPIGIYLKTDGVMVLSTASLVGADKKTYDPARNIVRPGDYIFKINGEKVENKKSLIKEMEGLRSKEVILELKRKEEKLSVRLNAVRTERDEYKLGIWVRDDTQGLGTITYLTKGSKFGALGHGIHDMDTNLLLEIEKGSLYDTSIRSVIKGEKGQPGSLEGIIVYNSYNRLGTIEKNTEIGIYGTLEKLDRLFEEQIPVKIGSRSKVTQGKAQIRCSTGGEVKFYDIEILEIDTYQRDVNKGFVIRVTDPELLEETGGIVQGMSGSPILQDGKLVGAVTHVFVNDPTKGYGIFIEDMLKETE